MREKHQTQISKVRSAALIVRLAQKWRQNLKRLDQQDLGDWSTYNFGYLITQGFVLI